MPVKAIWPGPLQVLGVTRCLEKGTMQPETQVQKQKW